MKRKIFSFLIIFTFLSASFGQEAEKQEDKKDTPVYLPWNSGTLIDQQTSYIPDVKTFESLIQHRFGSIQSSMSDLYGIYSPGANLRMGFNYVILKNVQIGYGLTKVRMYNDFNIKWTVFEQTVKNKIPVSITLFGNATINGKADDSFGLNYAFGNRASYFSQLIIGRKISDVFSVQAGVSFTHFNFATVGMDHDVVALHFGGKFQFSPQSSIIINYDHPLEIQSISGQRVVPSYTSNLSFGLEVSTGTHSFQVFLTAATGILPQHIVMYNKNDWTDGSFAVGFVMTRLWGF